MLAAVDAEGVDAIWCLGDLTGYGPQPNECVRSVRERADVCLVGNHDLGVIDRLDLGDFSRDAAIAAYWTRDRLGADERSFLESLVPESRQPGAALFHGSARDPVWEYVLSEEAAAASLRLTTEPVVLVGHSHVALALHMDDGRIAGGLAAGGSELDLSGGRWLLNPGSVGQPRDGDDRAAWLLLDVDARTASFRRTPYDIAATQAEIREAGLPEALAARLASGA